MRKNILYPYTLEKKDGAIKLEISAGRSHKLLYIFVFFLAVIALVGSITFIITSDHFILRDYIITTCLSLVFLSAILYNLYILSWKSKGKEIFILYADKLEYIVENKPYKTEKHTFHFSRMDLAYGYTVGLHSKESIELDSEYDSRDTQGNYRILFYMDDGENYIDSERKIPIDVIRKIKKEYLCFPATKQHIRTII